MENTNRNIKNYDIGYNTTSSLLNSMTESFLIKIAAPHRKTQFTGKYLIKLVAYCHTDLQHQNKQLNVALLCFASIAPDVLLGPPETMNITPMTIEV